MNIHTKYKPFDMDDPEALKVMVQTETFNCPNCHRDIRVKLKPEHRDWESIAEHYRKRLFQVETTCFLLQQKLTGD